MMLSLQPVHQIAMQNQDYSSHRIQSSGSHTIPVYLWEPAGEATAVIQVFHGLGEHSARYHRFAEAAVNQGYAVCAHNHRGHGPEAEKPGFFAPEHGWRSLVDDGYNVTRFLRERFPGKPVVLLGHSMGSYIAQSYAMRHGRELTALVLSGSTWPARGLLLIGRLLARIVAWRHGIEANSPLLDKIGFGDFNKRFEPARTELDWLSRDPAEVDKYLTDPLCGGPYTTGLWIDLLGGLQEISKSDALQQIPAGLPILITGGADDPVGGERGMLKLADHFAQTGHNNLSTRTYAGGRHEMFNETNRDEFTADLLRWLENALPNHNVDNHNVDNHHA
jgi:alpha-beta hydrolase superfamily lysophospholipase